MPYYIVIPPCTIHLQHLPDWCKPSLVMKREIEMDGWKDRWMDGSMDGWIDGMDGSMECNQAQNYGVSLNSETL